MQGPRRKSTRIKRSQVASLIIILDNSGVYASLRPPRLISGDQSHLQLAGKATHGICEMKGHSGIQFKFILKKINWVKLINVILLKMKHQELIYGM